MKQLTKKQYKNSASHKKMLKMAKNYDKWSKKGLCVHCGSKKIRSEKYDAYYCPKCLYWTESICCDRTCFYCKDRPKYPRRTKNERFFK